MAEGIVQVAHTAQQHPKLDKNVCPINAPQLQVACNGLVPTVIAVVYGVFVGCVDVPLGPSTQVEAWRARLTTALAGAFLGYYASCCGDTWASELGPLSPHSPRLITTLRHVRRGTNGGVTLMGLAASGAGGALMGAVFYLAAVVSPTLWIFEAQRAQALAQWRLIPLGMAAGLVGSVIDSVLGATLQVGCLHACVHPEAHEKLATKTVEIVKTRALVCTSPAALRTQMVC